MNALQSRGPAAYVPEFANPSFAAEAERLGQGKHDAIVRGGEYASLATLAALYGVSKGSLEQGVNRGHLTSEFAIAITATPTTMFRLGEVAEWRGEPDADRLHEFRRNGMTVGFSGGGIVLVLAAEPHE